MAGLTTGSSQLHGRGYKCRQLPCEMLISPTFCHAFLYHGYSLPISYCFCIASGYPSHSGLAADGFGYHFLYGSWNSRVDFREYH